MRSIRMAVDRSAHPRVGGENGELEQNDAGAGGSSPRRRGKPAVRDVGVNVRGLIPA